MIVNTVFLVVIFALTIYGVFHGEDLGAMMEAMRRADVRWLLPGLFCVVFFIWGESIIIWYMMHSFQIPVKKRTCFLFSSVGFFFSCITPSASGGQPMQLYYMKKEKISLPVSTVILMIVTITYKAVLVVVGLGLVLFGQGFLHRYLTEILASSISGIFLATRGHFNWAIFCLAFSGLCDMFDGKIARTKKNRTEDEKRFGIQIDSLCDVVCFGVFPIVLCYELGMTHFYSIPILVFYGLAGVIRLGYFNVMEEKRQNETSENRKYYQGLPITSMSVALPLLFVFAPLCRGYFLIWLHLLVLAVGVLFITDFRFRKPTNKELAVLVAVVGVAVLRGLLIWKGGRTI